MARITWEDLPESIRARVEARLGSAVVRHESYPGGFSPGTADRVTCADGTEAFVKAVHADLNPESPGIHRMELHVMRELPPEVAAPALLDGFEEDGWVVLILGYVEGRHPALPWTWETFEPVLDATMALSESLTPKQENPAGKLVIRMTPACAGTTPLWAASSTPPWDDPRVRGDDFPASFPASFPDG